MSPTAADSAAPSTTAPARPPRRKQTVSPRRQATRERILEAAAELFAERGFHGTSVELVCERAGFTRGAFYSNYSSKDDLVLELSTRHTAQLIENIRAAADSPAASPEELVHRVLNAVAHHGDQRKQWLLLHTEFSLHALRTPEAGRAWARQQRQVRSAIAAEITQLSAQHGVELLVDAELLVRASVALSTGGLTQHLLEPRALPESTLERAVLSHLVVAAR